jgi:hypothetical protein
MQNSALSSATKLSVSLRVAARTAPLAVATLRGSGSGVAYE